MIQLFSLHKNITENRGMFFVLSSLLVLFLPAFVAAGQNNVKRPNVLFIAIDDLNDWTGCLGGHPQAKTPNLDRLAKKGVLFTRAYCSAPSCNPSRASMLSGVRPSTSGVYYNSQDWRPVLRDVVTLPHYFMMNGYLVWGGGKIFHGRYPNGKAWHEYFKGKSKFPRKKLPRNGIGGNMTWGPIPAGDDVMPDTQMTDWAIKKLKQKHKRPFFLAVGYVKPHLTWHAPEKYFAMHPLAKVKLPVVNDSDLNDVPPAGIKFARPQGDHAKITKKGNWKEAVQAYLATSTFMDHQLGRLIDALAHSEYADNTIIILWSDHGWHHGQKEHWRKFALWEQTTRVPLIMIAPGVTQPNQRCERPVNLMDIYPTLIDLCALPKRKLEGHSLVPLLKNPKAKWKYPSLTTYGKNNHTVRTDRWRYIRYANGDEELYDHTNDPYEWKNLARNEKYAALKKQLAQYFPKVNAANAPKVKGKKKRRRRKTQPTKPLVKVHGLSSPAQ